MRADDIAVVSKHDTSTSANDPNESELHTRLARALGRTEGNPLVAVSQKSITGHAKGGAALFQVAGLTEILVTGVAPGNASLDVVHMPPCLCMLFYTIWFYFFEYIHPSED